MIRFRCPLCRTRLIAFRGSAGGRTVCVVCHAPIAVPMRGQLAAGAIGTVASVIAYGAFWLLMVIIGVLLLFGLAGINPIAWLGLGSGFPA